MNLVPQGRDEDAEPMGGLRRRDEHAGRCCGQARRPLGVAAAGALLAVLVPKCPLCLGAYLSFLGAAASWVVWLRPLGIALTIAGLALASWRYLPRRALRAPDGGEVAMNPTSSSVQR